MGNSNNNLYQIEESEINRDYWIIIEYRDSSIWSEIIIESL